MENCFKILYTQISRHVATSQMNLNSQITGYHEVGDTRAGNRIPEQNPIIKVNKSELKRY